jgi:hypothetical protein
MRMPTLLFDCFLEWRKKAFFLFFVTNLKIGRFDKKTILKCCIKNLFDGATNIVLLKS